MDGKANVTHTVHTHRHRRGGEEEEANGLWTLSAQLIRCCTDLEEHSLQEHTHGHTMYALYTHTPKHIQESPKERKKKINNNKAVLRHNHKRPIDPKRADPFVAPPHPTDRQPLHIELHTNNRRGQQSCCSGLFSRYRYEVFQVTGVCSVSFISSLVQFSGCRLLAAVRASLTSRPKNKR